MADIAWTLYIFASIAVIIAPGQDMVLVLSRGLGQGALAGVVTAAGVSTGLIGHTILAALGLGTLLAASEVAYTVLKYVGAAYLCWLGFGLLTGRHGALETRTESGHSYRRLFFVGALSNISNPKITLFYFAFLPQFATGYAGSAGLQIFVLGLTFALITFLIKAPVGLFAGTLSGWFRTHPRALSWVFRISGAALIGFGVRLALSER